MHIYVETAHKRLLYGTIAKSKSHSAGDKFSSKCNCAALKVINRIMSIPPNIVSTMDGLRRVEIVHAGLQNQVPALGKRCHI